MQVKGKTAISTATLRHTFTHYQGWRSFTPERSLVRTQYRPPKEKPL